MGNPTVQFETSAGSFTAEIFMDKVPVTATNFLSLVNDGFYDGLIFHRVIDDFMIQAGDPNCAPDPADDRGLCGTGGPGSTIPDEFTPALRHDRKGLLSMANSGPNSGGSQFFITLVPTPWLDDRHAIFGAVIEGIEVVDAIGDAATGSNDRPVEPVVIERVRVI